MNFSIALIDFCLGAQDNYRDIEFDAGFPETFSEKTFPSFGR